MLLCIVVSEGFALNSLFSFVVFMVREFGYSDPADVRALLCRLAYSRRAGGGGGMRCVVVIGVHHMASGGGGRGGGAPGAAVARVR